MSKQSPKPRMEGHEKAERTNILISFTMAEKEVIGKAAHKEGKQMVKYCREKLLELARE